MMSGLFLSRDDLMLLSDSAREEVLALATGESISAVYEESEDGPTDLSSLQAERLVRGLSDKSRSVLKAILESEDGEQGFWCKSVAEELGFDVSELSGVWSGLTRRTRTVSDDHEDYLISWACDEDRDDYYGKLHPTTYRNCKKAMNF
ncbi:hypothetical protein [Yersinia mollaretii]|uniref:hypothetical protein n=1 Tax=Yersinia mollaretii TaxID=33060 RepID=UPI00061C3CEA|nr:hypothetical protein [Yersinia mollaretii]CNJ55129.1 Uncharacterised protein [Yersinia mollaretii]